MAFAQLTFRESLRDIETCLKSIQHKLCHSGFRSTVARNTLARANEKRDWRIYADLAQVLIPRARRLYRNETVRGGSGTNGLRLRFHHHRSLPVVVSLGLSFVGARALSSSTP